MKLLKRFGEWEYTKHGISKILPYVKGNKVKVGDDPDSRWGAMTGLSIFGTIIYM